MDQSNGILRLWKDYRLASLAIEELLDEKIIEIISPIQYKRISGC